jgi:NAD(P)-dependent dehydrogenase (short-subunit alcohol dehydrogenase family)
MAGVLNAELGQQGVRVYNIEPGFVFDGPIEEAHARFPGVPVTPAEAIGASVAWLATDEAAPRLLGKRVHGPQLCAREGLLPGWDGPA